MKDDDENNKSDNKDQACNDDTEKETINPEE